ncbi:MAG: site-specific integrase [Desulfotalea sp.]
MIIDRCLTNNRFYPNTDTTGGMCMKGGIYSEQKCPLCGASLKDDGRKKVSCPKHHQQVASNLRVHFGKVKRRFKSYQETQHFLTGLRYKTDEYSFDARDGQDNQLSFSVLAEKWLLIKEETVRPGSFRNLRNYMNKACEVWGSASIKTIGYGEIEDFLVGHGKKLSSKTISNMKSCLHDFFNWLVQRVSYPKSS